MPAEVIDLAAARLEREPHSSGTAICLDCKHEWVAVAPADMQWLECPSCGLVRGRFKFQFEKDCKHWVCNCGNDLFHVTPEGTYCPNCGEWHVFDD